MAVEEKGGGETDHPSHRWFWQLWETAHIECQHPEMPKLTSWAKMLWKPLRCGMNEEGDRLFLTQRQMRTRRNRCIALTRCNSMLSISTKTLRINIKRLCIKQQFTSRAEKKILHKFKTPVNLQNSNNRLRAGFRRKPSSFSNTQVIKPSHRESLLETLQYDSGEGIQKAMNFVDQREI